MTDAFDFVTKPTVLAVDDAPDNLALIANILQSHYRVKVAPNGDIALKLAHGASQPDLILLDIMMPGKDGYEVCRLLKQDPKTARIPIIFLTAKTDEADEEHGLQLGAADYITKPISPPILLARVKTQLENKAMADFLWDQNSVLEQEVARRTRELTRIQDVTILAMGALAETRDPETGLHIRRTQNYVKTLAQHLQSHPRFKTQLDDQTIAMLYKSAPLHDIGKVGIPDRILLKPGKLTPEEFEQMKAHTSLGAQAIANAEALLGEPVDFLIMAKEIALNHHEKWDGSGYPSGLAEDLIPTSARLMALADVYDALINRRVYKEPMSHAVACEIIWRGRGNHFDPDIVDAFLAVQSQFENIARRYADS